MVIVSEENRIVGAIVVNQTGMEGFSPNYICVYVTVEDDHDQRDVVLFHLLQKAIEHTNGDIAMHVKPDNPALRVYEKLGFEARYLELRLDKKRVIA